MRKRQVQIWSDIEFVNRLKKIRARKMLAGIPIKSIGELTKEILNCPSFEKLEKELLGESKEFNKIRFDGEF